MMRAVDLIEKKRNGGEHSSAEVAYLVDGFVAGQIPDYQMAAWLMAVYFRGMSERETVALTMAMVNSGTVCDLSSLSGIKVDKHSTGGVADTTTLVVVPLVAAAGVPVAKMSGRGLGHTGGTIDKLESFAGLRTDLTPEQMIAQVKRFGMAIVGQSPGLTPADKKMYALRDVTATVHSIPLIAASIMSKKIAAGADAIVLDVKVGSGAFMKNMEDARSLAETMVRIGTSVGKRTVALLTAMDQPLGRAIGNALEVKEAIDVLSNRVHGRLRDLCLALAAEMTVLANVFAEYDEAYAELETLLDSGAALECLRRFVIAQGGSGLEVNEPDRLPQAASVIPVHAEQSGFIAAVDAARLGHLAMLLGAGRAEQTSTIDLAVGLRLHKRVGESVVTGEVLAELHTQTEEESSLKQWKQMVREAFRVSDGPVGDSKQILARVEQI